MIHYIIRRLLLVPVTLFAIILVNFVILNLAPGDPSTLANISATGEATRSSDSAGATGENQYLIFREHYGLTLPILLNRWPYLTPKAVKKGVETLALSKGQMSVQAYHKLRTLWGDRARFVMPFLLHEASNAQNPFSVRQMAANLFIRGGIRQGAVGATLSAEERKRNRAISENNLFLASLRVANEDPPAELDEKVEQLEEWFQKMGGAIFSPKEDGRKSERCSLKPAFAVI